MLFHIGPVNFLFCACEENLMLNIFTNLDFHMHIKKDLEETQSGDAEQEIKVNIPDFVQVFQGSGIEG